MGDTIESPTASATQIYEEDEILSNIWKVAAGAGGALVATLISGAMEKKRLQDFFKGATIALLSTVLFLYGEYVEAHPGYFGDDHGFTAKLLIWVAAAVVTICAFYQFFLYKTHARVENGVATWPNAEGRATHDPPIIIDVLWSLSAVSLLFLFVSIFMVAGSPATNRILGKE